MARRPVTRRIEKANPPKTYYVYTLAKPDGTVFYVGKGQGDRIDQHEFHAKYLDEAIEKYRLNPRKCAEIRKIWDNGGRVVKSIVYETPIEEDAYVYEWVLIHMVYGPEQLTNYPFVIWRDARNPSKKTSTVRTSSTKYELAPKATIKQVPFLTVNNILDADEVGKMLKIHPRTVKRLASQGELPGFKVGGQWRFRREVIEEYIRRQEQQHGDQKSDD